MICVEGTQSQRESQFLHEIHLISQRDKTTMKNQDTKRSPHHTTPLLLIPDHYLQVNLSSELNARSQPAVVVGMRLEALDITLRYSGCILELSRPCHPLRNKNTHCQPRIIALACI